MKTETVYLNNACELDSFVITHKNGHFLQTSFWGRVKDDWKWFGVICRNREGSITGTLAVLLRRISKTPYHLMYAPRGPVCDLDDSDTIKSLIEAAKIEGKKYNAYKLKIDKDAPAENDIYKSFMLSMGFRLKKRTLGFEDFQCRHVFRLNLNGKTEEEIFSSFYPKHRYNIRLALKRGVKIKICTKEDVKAFSDIMNATGKRDGFSVPHAEHFAKILDAFSENARLYIAYYDHAPIAGALAVRCGGKVWYFYGGSLNFHRNVMPNYLLQWEMIKWAIESNCEIYDFRGVSGNTDKSSPLYGLYRFKKGFNGEFIEFLGETDLILNPFADKIIDISQKIIKYFR